MIEKKITTKMKITMIILPIEIILVGIVTDVRDEHNSKAPSLIEVTLVGITMLVRGQCAYW